MIKHTTNRLSLQTSLRFISLFLLLSASYTLLAEGQEQAAAINADEQLPLQDIHTFVEVFHQIRSHYVNDVSDEELLEYAINGMLNGLDPHSSYLNRAAFSDLQESTKGEFAGIGLEVSMENGFVKVISPIDDTPAKKAGIQAGDLIIKLNGQAVKGMSLNEAIDLMRGPKGSKVSLTLIRENTNTPQEIKLKRAIIRIKSVKTELLEQGFAYLRIAQFQADTGKDAQKQILKLEKKWGQPLNGLVIDLRNNPGGVLTAAIEIGDLFLTEGIIVYTEGRSKSSQEKFVASEAQLLKDKPIIVLMNKGSASASEIVAGALQDHKRALIVGTQSFGKGSVQSILPLPKNRGIKLTTARYYTPLGRSIQAEGIKPDIEIQNAKLVPIEAEFGITEAELSGHLQNKQQSKKAHKKTKTAKDDYQLFTAINLLKAMSLKQP
ncbi:MAG: S41 family peptidase [Pseudomonadales bacterium]|nr:S41 family peptidase [Pseudomonadales bacterium]